MKVYTEKKIQNVLNLHKLWLKNDKEGLCANLSDANLKSANLRDADLSNADLSNADLSFADLSFANLSDANLKNADLDFSCWPLWCGSLTVKTDNKLKVQLLYHIISIIGTDFFTDEQVNFANTFHRIPEVKELKK